MNGDQSSEDDLLVSYANFRLIFARAVNSIPVCDAGIKIRQQFRTLQLCYAVREKFFAIEIMFKSKKENSALLPMLRPPLYLLKIKPEMDATQILGLVAGALTTAAFLPQVVKTWKSRSAKDLSLGMFSLFCGGVFLWLVYGFAVGDVPVIAANLLTLLLASTLLFFKLRFKR
jgi:MtN3 and saliva related transmembrane protein